MKNVEIFFLNVLPEDRHWNWNVYFIFTFCSKKTLSGGVTHGKWPLPAEPYPGKCSHSVNHVSRKVHGHFPGYGSRKAEAKHKEKSATNPPVLPEFCCKITFRALYPGKWPLSTVWFKECERFLGKSESKFANISEKSQQKSKQFYRLKIGHGRCQLMKKRV